MRSPILYDWWLRDGMINTDRQVDWAWRQMLAKTCDPEYWAARTGDSPTETTRIVRAGQEDQEVINLN